MRNNHKTTPESLFKEWAKNKEPEYVRGYLDGISQVFSSLPELLKNSASNDTE